MKWKCFHVCLPLQCYYCTTTKICDEYPAKEILPTKHCALSAARWGVCFRKWLPVVRISWDRLPGCDLFEEDHTNDRLSLKECSEILHSLIYHLKLKKRHKPGTYFNKVFHNYKKGGVEQILSD